MHNFVGQQIGRYRIIEQQGMGGMAVVYHAYDTRLERDVAIKVIRTEAIPPEQYQRMMIRFEREAKSQAGFSHPNIVPVYDYGEVNGSPYIVMEYIAGGTLKDKLGTPFPFHQAITWLAPIANALSYAHRLGVIHRDVKPSNILFDVEGRPILTDFGIAKILENTEVSLTGTGLGVGTPEYMAPEQWQGNATEASDQYALGVVLFELLTGQKPYTAETPVAIALKQMSEPLQRPSELVPSIPEGVEKTLYKALSITPGDRYETMSDFYKALIVLLRDQDFVMTPGEGRTADSEGETIDILETTPAHVTISKSKTEIGEKKLRKRQTFPMWAVWGGLGMLLIFLMGIGAVYALRSGSLFGGNPTIESIAGNENQLQDGDVVNQQEDDVAVMPNSTNTKMASTAMIVSTDEPTRPTENKTATSSTDVYITPTPQVYSPIQGCAVSQLHIGDSAFVSYDGGKNRIRSEPDTSKDNGIAEIQPGEVVRIIEGPECNFGWILWEVETTSHETGWTPETDGDEFWLLPISTREICEGALPTRLLVGKKAKVNEEPPDANLLRTDPSRFDDVIDRIKPGHWMMVLEGPVCGEKTHWWKVESLDTGKVGWTMEGNLEIYYLSPEP